MDVKSAHNLASKDRTEDIEIPENVCFADMHLSDSVLTGLHTSGFIRPSPIQLQALPLGNCGLDLIIQAKSGTGKTCVFAVIALEMISVIAKTTQVLVVAPTREIAVQISQVVNTIGSAKLDLRASTFIGGIDLNQDKAKLKCCHIAIGTPGRLNQLVSLGILNLNNVRLLVLDEADQLLTGQFKDAILQLVTTLPLNKQVLALSATYPNEVTNFLDKFMRKPTHVRLGRESPALIGVNQFVRLVPNHPQPHQRHKIKMYELISLLSSTSFNQCLVFSNSQLRAESVCNQLISHGWPASYLTGGQPQKDRLQAFQDLCTYRCRILVSTDLSARGLDSEHVNFVINLDIPNEQATYMHRIGRAGRFGSKGGAVTIVCEGEEWEAMKAIATLANVKVYIMTEDWSSGISLPDNAEELQYLSEGECISWLEIQNKNKIHSKKKHNGLKSSNKYNLIENGNELASKTVDKLCNGVDNIDIPEESNESSTSSCYTNYHEKNSENNDLPSRPMQCKKNSTDVKKNGGHYSIIEDQYSIISGKEDIELMESKQCSIKRLLSKLVNNEMNISFTHDKIYQECLERWETLTNRDTAPRKLSGATKGNDVINETLIESYLTYMEEKLADVTEDSSFKLTDIKLSLQNVIDGVNPLKLQDDLMSDSPNMDINNEIPITNPNINELNNYDLPIVSCVAESSSSSKGYNTNYIMHESNTSSECTSGKKGEEVVLYMPVHNGHIENSVRKKSNSELNDSVENIKSCDNINNVSQNTLLNLDHLSNNSKDETNISHSCNDNSDRKKFKQTNNHANTGYGMWQTLNHTSELKSSVNPSIEKSVKPKRRSCHKNETKHVDKTVRSNLNCDEHLNYNTNIDSSLYNDLLGESYWSKRPAKKLANSKMCSYNDTDDTLNFYINSAAKFTSMVEYCRHLGKMSASMAKFNNHRLTGSYFKKFS